MEERKIRLSKCSLGATERQLVDEVLQREFLGMGTDTRAFEEELAAYIGNGRSVTCVSTGTAALQLALQACGIGTGDEVLVPSLTFVASFQAIAATGATPVACDVHAATATIDIGDAIRRVTRKTKAIMPVHYASYLPHVVEIYEAARAHGLRVIEDAAHAFGGTHKGQRIGAEGDIVCFSFDGIKNITCGEGGAVVTGDQEIRKRVEDARLLGVQRDTEMRYSGKRSWNFDVTSIGWRYHMSNIMAAIGRAQLPRLATEFAPRRVELARRYRGALERIEGVRLLDSNLDEVVPHIMPVRVLRDMRDTVYAELAMRGIETGIHYKPNHLLSLFRTKDEKFPVTDQLYSELLTLPLHTDLSGEDVDRVVSELLKSLEGSAAKGMNE